MTQQSNANTTGESIDDCELTQSERNRFFHGKLMTARDMEAEQVYHRGLFTRDSRHVTGYGVVDGLDATVRSVAEGLEVTVTPGYAIDCCGRPVVVPTETTDVVEEWEQREEGDLALYLEYEECVTESVPIPGSEDACERECAYNRVVETFSLDIRPAPGREKPVPPVEFPSTRDFDWELVTKKRVEQHEIEDLNVKKRAASQAQPDGGSTGLPRVSGGSTNQPLQEAPELPSNHPALTKIARSFDELDDRHGMAPLGCPDTGDHAVYLGQFPLPKEGETEDVDAEMRPRVYTNDMLYSAIARHTADFGNPHDVVASLNRLTGDLKMTSDDGSVTISTNSGAGTIDLSDAGTAQLRLLALTCALDVFGDVADEFDNAAARDLGDAFRDALESGDVAANPETFLAFMRGDADYIDSVERQGAVTDEFGAHVGGQDHYTEQHAELEEAVDAGDANDAAVAQLLVCDAARQFSGTRIDLARFFPNDTPGRPLTIDSVIFEAAGRDGIALVWSHQLSNQNGTYASDGGEDVLASEELMLTTSTGKVVNLEGHLKTADFVPENMTIVQEIEENQPHVVLAFRILYVDIPATEYVEGDVIAPEQGMVVMAVDPEGDPIGDEPVEVDPGEQTFTIEASEGIDRLALFSGLGDAKTPRRPPGALEELRFR